MKHKINNEYLNMLMIIVFIIVALFFTGLMANMVFASTGCAIGAFLGDGVVTAGMIDNYESTISRKVAAITFFKDWTSSFPVSECNTITDKGSIPIITWEPRNWADPNDTAKVYELQDIINGDHDPFLTSYATAVKNWGKPVFIRPAHEMNSNWYPWSGASNGGNEAAAAKYIAAWRHIHDIFTSVGAANVIWAWCPNNWSVPNEAWNELADYYPGDPYVDWIGFDGYSRPAPNWYDFYVLFGWAYTTFDPYGKPMMIGEMACAEDASKASWISDTFLNTNSIKQRYPNIKLYTWFNMDKEYDWRVNSSAASETAFKFSMADPYYLSTLEVGILGPEDSPSFEAGGGMMVAYPNPFNPDDPLNRLKMQFHANAGYVDIYIHDLAGRIVQKITPPPYAVGQDATVEWDGRYFYNSVVPNGVYLIRVVQNGRLVAKGKILAVKR